MPGYQVKFESVLIGDTRYPIRSLLDGNQYHDPDGAAAAAGIPEAAWPLFGLVWPSARIMADAMLSKNIRGKRILEVGCGLGLASLVLQQRGGDITASDCHPLTDSFLQHNAQRCGLPAVPYLNGNWGTANPALGKFDLIIGSDLLYDRELPSQLAGFLDRHCADNAEVIVLDPGRGNKNAFTRAMQARGYRFSERAAARQQNSGEAYKGHFLTYTRGRIDS
ncbi:class I SAM-dependent methyltransferase [Vogesella indigofera]|uniref:class I SAM-dependent methyltransferase n=1 Tax=Vogesella indigofera TaxID=45465 RepID=UPI00234F1F9C|nr:methyltransferase domain-containing protein [Vogesella indigofera]MDC7706705.1 methyltransferase domain-containing protein [Vogesella indigofera]